MASLSHTIEIIFAGVDNATSEIQNINSSIGNFAGGIEDATQPLADLATNMVKAETAILSVGAAMAGLAISEAGKYKESITEIGTLFNGTSEQVNTLEEDLKNYASSSTSSLEAINKATYIAISTGTEFTEVTTALGAAEKLATAGAAELDIATGALSRTMNAYGLDVEDSERITDALFTTIQNGDTTLDALAGNLGKVATTASGAEVGLEEMLSALAAVTISGVSTSQATTQLNALFKELASPSEELTKALGGMSLETNSLQEIMNQLQTQTGGSLEGFNKLFPSIEASKAAMVLGNDAAGAFDKSLQAMEVNTGAVTEANKEMEVQFSSINQNLANNFKLTLIEIGGPLLESYGDSVGALSEILKGVQEGVKSPNFDVIYDAVDSFVGDISDKLREIALVLPEAMSNVDFSGLVQKFGKISDAISDLFGIAQGDIDLSTAEGLTTAIQNIVDMFAKFTTVTAGIIEGYAPLVEWFSTLAGEVIDADDETATFIGNILGYGTSVNSFAGLISDLSGYFDTLVTAIALVVSANGLGALPISFASATTAVQALASAMTSPAGLVAGAGAAGVAVGTMIGETDTAKSVFGSLIASIDKATGIFGDHSKALEEAEKFTKSLNETQKEQIPTNEDIAAKLAITAEATKEAAKEEVDYDKIVSDTAFSLKEKAVEQARAKLTAEDLTEAIRIATGEEEFSEESRQKAIESLTKKTDLENKEINSINGVREATGGFYKELDDGNEIYLTNKDIRELNFVLLNEEEEAIGKVERANGGLFITQEGIGKVYLENNDIKNLKLALDNEEANSVTKVEKVSNGYFKTLENGNKIFVKNAEVKKKVSDADKVLAEETEKRAKAEKEAIERADKLTESYAQMAVELEKVASNERIKSMEFAVNLNVAKLEAETARVEAAFNSMNSLVESSQAAVVDLAGVYAGLSSHTSQSNFIEELLESNQKIAEDAAAKALELVDAQIKHLQESTSKIQSGEPLISVDGGELQPELESIMKSLFHSIQIEMSQTYEDYLLGVPA